MNFTDQQKQAIAARGNVLVIAGAGTGKTRTLVERCLNILLEEKPPVSLDEILMVTFTEAAAAEMRQRIRLRLEEELKKNPNAYRWHEQLALFETAHIGTLHSFCLKLVRQYFYELELDPQLTVLPEEEARLLIEETLTAVLQAHYSGDDLAAAAVQQLIQTQGRGWDKPVRALVLKLHHYTQTLPDPEGWFREQLGLFNSPEPARWREWLPAAVEEWRHNSLAFLRPLASTNELAARCVSLLEDGRGDSKVPSDATLDSIRWRADLLERILEVPAECPWGKKTTLLKPLENVFVDAGFLRSLMPDETKDPLSEDWNWTRSHMAALLGLAQKFQEQYAGIKRELGALDFHDLEQHTLRLLWKRGTGQPSEIAHQWRQKLKFVFVDEYQDINAAQDKIIEALSHGSAGSAADRQDAAPPATARGNRFLVGDVKQSIYRFRLANPHIFQNYAMTWHGGRGETIPLTENFRSRESLLGFVNSLFDLLMQGQAGSLRYDEQARLRFGAPAERQPLSLAANPEPRVELHLRRIGAGESLAFEESGENGDIAEMADVEKEARLVALRLRDMKVRQHKVWNDATKGFRAVDWRDMAVLLRSPANKAEAFAKEFSRLGLPLAVARGGFYQSLEISDLLSLLQLLDNPLQDVPLLAVLRSPLVGLTLDELATIRLAAVKQPCWTALRRWTEAAEKGCGESTLAKVGAFLEHFARWRKQVRQVSLSRCLNSILAETHYAEWLLTQPRGEQRRANVQRLLSLAQRFDQFQRQGLFRFLRFVEAQQETETEPEAAAASEENAIRLMSIHQSKGLEFPVVVVADLGKPFNFSDSSAEVILDEDYGLCAQIRPPHTGGRYPSLPLWLAQRRQRVETLGEELRLLYVATTRAQDTLILTATIPEKRFATRWQSGEAAQIGDVSAAKSYADWLGSWFAKHIRTGGENGGKTQHLLWTIREDSELTEQIAKESDAGLNSATFEADDNVWRLLEQRLSWQYPFAAAATRPAKASVTTLRHQAAEAADDEAMPLDDFTFAISGAQSSQERGRRRGAASAAEYGTAHHRFLQFVSLDCVTSKETLRDEARRLVQTGKLSPDEAGTLDFVSVAAFWKSEPGQQILTQKECIRRELAFAARFSPLELAAVTGETLAPDLADEFVVVQGVADLAVILPREIWLLDFKTDDISGGELEARAAHYAPQLTLYSQALERIYRRPVTMSWLHFLAAGKTLRLEVKPGASLK